MRSPTCAISNTSFTPGQDTGLMLLTPTPFNLPYRTVTDGWDTHKPFLPPIFGTYATGGTLTDIQQSPVTDYLETTFQVPIKTFIDAVIVPKIVTGVMIQSRNYSPPLRSQQFIPGTATAITAKAIVQHEALFSPDKVRMGALHTWNKTDQIIEYLAVAGFTPITLKKASFNGYTLEIKGRQIIISNGDNFMKQITIPLRVRKTLSFILEIFGLTTGIWPCYPEDKWEKMSLFNKMTGMFYRKDLVDAGLPLVSKYMIYEAELEYMTEEETTVSTVSRLNALGVRTDDQQTALERIKRTYVDSFREFSVNLTDFETRAEFGLKERKEWLDVKFVLKGLRKPLAPSAKDDDLIPEVTDFQNLAKAVHKAAFNS